MSYNITLEELLNHLNQAEDRSCSPNPYQQRYKQYQQQQRQAHAAALAAERQRQAAAYRERERQEAAARAAYAATFANHPFFHNGSLYQDEREEEDEDEEYDPGYYYYYNQLPPQQTHRQPFFQPVKGPTSSPPPAQVRAQTSPSVAAPAPVAPIVRRKYPKSDQFEADGAFDLTQLLNFLVGDHSESEKKEKKEEIKDKEEPKPEIKADVESAEVPKAAVEAESKKKESESKPAFIPHLKRHTSTLTPEKTEPEPKIEISTRNFKNESLPYSPQTNVYDLPTEYIAVLAIPGANLKDLQIDFHAATNEVVVKGDIPSPFATEDLKQIKNLEIRSGAIERRIKFPHLPKINDDDIKANYLNGLLTVKIPKKKDDGLVKAKRKVVIEDVPDEELVYESNADNFVK